MSRMVFCVKLGKELEGLEEPPQPGELGERVFENVSKDAWKMWMSHQIMLINEYRLNLTDPKANEFLDQQMEQFFFGEGAAAPPDYVPPTQPSK
ncbi:MAG: oxidative damage protection protein [Deferribacteres bacterium]|nr:oxidative damage protection protein [candidate division KSB1 bacterium]MCB9508799.1 oxidative damage protection protein [Deferribacteres bacterium]